MKSFKAMQSESREKNRGLFWFLVMAPSCLVLAVTLPPPPPPKPPPHASRGAVPTAVLAGAPAAILAPACAPAAAAAPAAPSAALTQTTALRFCPVRSYAGRRRCRRRLRSPLSSRRIFRFSFYISVVLHFPGGSIDTDSGSRAVSTSPSCWGPESGPQRRARGGQARGA